MQSDSENTTHESTTHKAEAEWALGLLESTPDGIALYDPNNRVVFANKKFCAMWQLDRSTLLGMSQPKLHAHKVAMLSDPEQDAHLLSAAAGQHNEFETNYIRLKGGMWCERLVYDHIVNAECVGHVVQWRDVTSRHNALVLMQHERGLSMQPKPAGKSWETLLAHMALHMTSRNTSVRRPCFGSRPTLTH